MRVIADTSVWSLALRRRPKELSRGEKGLVLLMGDLVREDLVILPGVVRQEVLSGIPDAGVFDRLAAYLRGFDDVPVGVADYEEAARCRDACDAAGVAASLADVLLCALSIRLGVAIWTTDADFGRYAKALPVRLATPAGLRAVVRRLGR